LRKLNPRRKTTPKTKDEEGLRKFVDEADKVKQLTNSAGWDIIRRDCLDYLSQIASRLAYLNPSSKEFYEARVLFIAADKLLNLVEDYEFNRKKCLQLLKDLQNLDNTIVLDVDNE